MLLCVILVWTTKVEEFLNSLIFMQNVFEVWEFKENWLKILFLGKLGSKQVFLKSISSHTHAFFHKILCFEEFLHKIALFFKKLIFPEFQSIKPVSRPIEIAIKNLVWFCLFRSMLDRCWINQRHFRLIESKFRSIKILEKPIFWKTKQIFCRNSSKHSILWIKCMSMRWNAFQKTLVLNSVFPKLRVSNNSP